MPGKAWATISHLVLVAAGLVGILIVAVTMAAGDLRTGLGVDLTKWIALATALNGALFYVGKGIAHLGSTPDPTIVSDPLAGTEGDPPDSALAAASASASSPAA